LPNNCTEGALKKTFGDFVECALPQYQGQLKGFAFLTFGSAEEASAILNSGETYKVNGRDVIVDAPKRGKNDPKSPKPDFTEERARTLFVKNISDETTENELQELFEAEKVTLPTDPNTGGHRGFVLVIGRCMSPSTVYSTDLLLFCCLPLMQSTKLWRRSKVLS
jgi:RNA recognition motif-containing protein